MKTLLALALFVYAAQSFSEPHYWMKQYPNADKAKVQKCLKVAEEVRNKELTGGVMGNDVPWATLKQGNAWEKCMEGK